MTRNDRYRIAVRTAPMVVCVLLLSGLDCFAQEGAPSQAAGAESVDATAAQDLSAAIAVVSRLQAALVDAAKLEAVQDRFDFLQPEIMATHDLEFIARLTVRRQWRALSESQRGDFLGRFNRLSVMSYARRFLNVDERSFESPRSESIGGGRVQVDSGILRADGSAVPLEYVLQDGDAGWRIVNVVADGVSDIALKRAEYQALFEAGGFDALIGGIESQTRELTESEAN